MMTDLLTKTWSGFSTREYKSYKGLTKENLRDNMTNMELVLNLLAEVSSTEISKSNDIKNKDNAKYRLSKAGLLQKMLENKYKKRLIRK